MTNEKKKVMSARNPGTSPWEPDLSVKPGSYH